jgi:uncharacterized protein (DUF885 family)
LIVHKLMKTLLTLLLCCVSSSAPPASSDFDALVDRYFDAYFQFHPSSATAAGFHQYDTEIEDLAPQTVKAELASLSQFQTEFDRFPKTQLSETAAGDFEFVDSTIKARILDLQTTQSWRRDPDFYTQTASGSIFLIMKRNFAPQAERLRSVIAREKQIPRLFDQARANLNNSPRVFTEIALQQLPDTVEFFRKDVPEAFTEVKDSALLAEFKRSNEGAAAALQNYEKFLKDTWLAKSKGDFRLGAENYRKKLLYEEMVDIPLDRLLEIGFADLHHNQQRLKEVAAQIDPKRNPQEVLAELQQDHPKPQDLLQTFRNKLSELRDFIRAKNIATVPSEILPMVEETPPFERALTVASMDTPGAYENKATEAFFNVTLPAPDWSAQKTAEWMQGFNRGTIASTAIHEVYPGHYFQFLWIKSAPSKTRKLLFTGANAEGWAHYCEQMMLDEGYRNNDPKLRMGQLQDALLRDARYIAGIQMHTGKMTLDAAREFFIKEGYQPPAVADEESKRGTSDPTYLVYTLGKLQIMKLREDYAKLKGDSFSLKEFHDTLMLQGGVPLKIIRQAMLGNNGPTL